MTRTDEQVTLVVTVSNEPALTHSLTAHRPTEALFVVSPKSERVVSESLAKASAEGLELPESRRRLLRLTDPDDLDNCVGEIREQTTDLEDRISSFRPSRLIVDFTGGTKAMSSALVLVARDWDCEWSYVAGDRDRGGMGVVRSGAEQICRLSSANSIRWDVLRPQFISLFNAGDYDAAWRIADAQHRTAARESRMRRRWTAAGALAGAYHYWDLFQYRRAAEQFKQLVRPPAPGSGGPAAEGGAAPPRYYYEGEMAALVGDGAAALLDRLAEHRERVLALEQGGRLSEVLLRDLLANARRCQARGRWDDATARLYRAVELSAQIRLHAEYGINTSAVSVPALPEALRGAAWGEPDADGKVKWGLQTAYRALALLGDPLGERFAPLFPPGASPLEARNSSLLAHGTQPVNEKDFESLWTRTLELRELHATDLLEFPRLGGAGMEPDEESGRGEAAGPAPEAKEGGE